MSADPAAARPAGASPTACLTPATLPDGDGDVARNRSLLFRPELCLAVERVEELGRPWTLQVIAHRARLGPLFVVPHDDEDGAFDSAVAAVLRHGGTAVAVETGGERLNRGLDPNRIFAETGACPGSGPAPRLTQAVLNHRRPGQPVIALHTNRPGGTDGLHRRDATRLPFPAAAPAGAFASPDTLVVVATARPTGADERLAATIRRLQQAGVRVLLERVTAERSDCSLSNFAALVGLPYLNVEVVQGEATGAQGRIVDLILGGP